MGRPTAYPEVTKNIPSRQGQAEMAVQSDYMDLGLVDLKEIKMRNRDAVKMLFKMEIRQSTKDKISFTVHMMNMLFSSVIAAEAPQHFYIWHTIVTAFLLCFRIRHYIKTRQIFFFCDFCYFTNILIFLYLWLPQSVLGPELRGRLFTVCFILATGPMLLAIIIWTFSFVPHSNDKMTSVFIHFSPSVALYGLRWYSTPDQGFPLCHSHYSAGLASCSSLTIVESRLYPMAAYLFWQSYYIILVDLLLWNRVVEGDYATSYRTFLRHTSGRLYNLFSVLGKSFHKPAFVGWQVVYTAVLINVLCYCFFLSLNIALLMVTLAYSIHSGASYYIDIFSVNYQLKHPKPRR